MWDVFEKETEIFEGVEGPDLMKLKILIFVFDSDIAFENVPGTVELEGVHGELQVFFIDIFCHRFK